MLIELNLEQKNAHDKILEWFKLNRFNRGSLLTLGGYAGVGKTTLMGFVAKTLKKENFNIAFCTISGKASTVLKSKLKEFLTDQDYCGTIHSLIYRLIGKEKLKSGRHELYFEHNQEKVLPYDLIIIDEASMVNEYIFRDLSSYGIPILAVGDHGQLPPVRGTFNLMQNPQIRLEKIMRQAENNPIIQMATMARMDGVIKYGQYGHCLKTRDTSVLHKHEFGTNSIMLCAMNKTRNKMNSFAREKLKIVDPYPVIGEPLICLYNNNKKLIYNGNIGILKDINILRNSDDEEVYDVDIDMGEFIFSNNIDPHHFGKPYTSVEEKSNDLDYFDWGYCITTHKAQGSEWQTVLVIEEGDFMFKGDLWNRWLYTAVTRSKENLIIYKR